jgi:hypothetical protein
MRVYQGMEDDVSVGVRDRAELLGRDHAGQDELLVRRRRLDCDAGRTHGQ